MTRLLVLVSLALTCIAVAACGKEASSATTATTTAATSSVKSAAATTKSPEEPDLDVGGDRQGRDADDEEVYDFGEQAGSADTHAVTALLERYYVAASRHDGATGCALLYSPAAESVVEDYGRLLASPSLRGETCAVVMTKIFKQQGRQVSRDAARLHVVQVRVKGNQGLVLLKFGKGKLENQILVQREHGAWKVKWFLAAGIL